MAVYSHERYNTLVEQTVKNLKELASIKGGEYAGDQDRLANFRRNAENLGLLQEQVWAVYAGKHYDAIAQYIKDLGKNISRHRMESISGRADDLIVYLTLFKAMVDEREMGLGTVIPIAHY